MVLLDTGTLGTSREIYNEDADVEKFTVRMPKFREIYSEDVGILTVNFSTGTRRSCVQ